MDLQYNVYHNITYDSSLKFKDGVTMFYSFKCFHFLSLFFFLFSFLSSFAELRNAFVLRFK